jgi:hypothetical protein
MKIRHGFVSNSSSSSFLIYGVCLEDYSAKTAKLVGDEEGSLDTHEIQKKLKEKVAGLGLERHSPPYSDSTYIGVSWDKVKDDETGAQFKARVEDALEKAFGTKLTCSTHEDAWTDN